MNKNIIKKVLLVLIIVFSIFAFGCTKEQEKELLKFDIHTDVQNNYLNNTRDTASLYAKGQEELSYPEPIHLSWDGESKDYKVLLSFNSDYSDSIVYYTDTNKISIYNLYIKKVYYYQVLDDDDKEVDYGKFVIDCNGPRNVYIDGVTNSRDIGGWLCNDGLVIKQGLVYRTSKFNEDESTNLVINDVGINTLVKVFKVKTEIDLRTVDDNENGGITESVLGNNVKYYSIPMVSNGNILLLNKAKVKDLFAILGDDSNYPLVFHCSIGTDRTGFVAFLMLGLLDCEEDSIYRDYAFSNFGLIYRLRLTTVLDNYISTLKLNYSGETLKELIENYLLDCGVEKSDIDNFINLMKEEYTPYE